MMHSDKYATVSMGDNGTVLVRIKKPTPVMEADKVKLIAWAQENGFIVSNRKRILHAE